MMKKTIAITCPCGSKFEVSCAEQKRRPRTYCSRKCASEARRLPRELRYCERCDTSFYALASSSQRFCSSKCSHEYTNELNRAAQEEESPITAAPPPSPSPTSGLTSCEYDGVTDAMYDPFGVREKNQIYYHRTPKLSFKISKM